MTHLDDPPYLALLRAELAFQFERAERSGATPPDDYELDHLMVYYAAGHLAVEQLVSIHDGETRLFPIAQGTQITFSRIGFMRIHSALHISVFPWLVREGVAYEPVLPTQNDLQQGELGPNWNTISCLGVILTPVAFATAEATTRFAIASHWSAEHPHLEFRAYPGGAACSVKPLPEMPQAV